MYEETAYVVVFAVTDSVEVTVPNQEESLSLSVGEYGYVGSADCTSDDELIKWHLHTEDNSVSPKAIIDSVLQLNDVSIVCVFKSNSLSACEIQQRLVDEYCWSLTTFGRFDCDCQSHILKGGVTGSCLKAGLTFHQV